MIIYRALCTINNKPYYGKTTKTLEHRKKKHLEEARYGKRRKVIFHRAIIKYGEENFIWEIIDTANSAEELAQKELALIQEFNVFKKNGYNHAMVSNISTISDEGRKSISDKAKLRCGPLSSFYGKSHTPEVKKIIYDKIKKPFKTIVDQFHKMGCVLLFDEAIYTSEKQRADYICPNGHLQNIKMYTIFREERRCWKCFHDSKRTPYLKLKNDIEKFGFQLNLTENEYINNYSTKIKVKCNLGHEREMVTANILRGAKCADCRYRKFSQEELQIIKTLYENNNSVMSIARKFNTTDNVIKNRLNKMYD